jgi:hypothetical protein
MRPLLDTMSDLGFVMLDRTPDREVVFGVVGQFWRARGVEQPHLSTPDEFLSFDDPRFAKVAANVAVRPGPRPGTSLVHTETRVHVPDPLLRRRFARYWRLIGGGSGFIRRQWLAGIKRRAERVSDPGSSGEE